MISLAVAHGDLRRVFIFVTTCLSPRLTELAGLACLPTLKLVKELVLLRLCHPLAAIGLQAFVEKALECRFQIIRIRGRSWHWQGG